MSSSESFKVRERAEARLGRREERFDRFGDNESRRDNAMTDTRVRKFTLTAARIRLP